MLSTYNPLMVCPFPSNLPAKATLAPIGFHKRSGAFFAQSEAFPSFTTISAPNDIVLFSKLSPLARNQKPYNCSFVLIVNIVKSLLYQLVSYAFTTPSRFIAESAKCLSTGVSPSIAAQYVSKSRLVQR